MKSNQIPALSKVDQDRYWSEVEKSGNERGCWIWKGSKNSKGYGRFFVEGKHKSAQRISWLLAGRAIQTNLLICHTCDNKACVNPDHLIMADNGTNSRVAMLKRNLEGKHAKAKKPHKDFPLFPHATRRWAKKIRGKLVCFGSTINDPNGEAALSRWLEQKDDLIAGRAPRVQGDGLTISDLCNRFLTEKQDLVNTGELSPRTFRDYKDTCGIIVAAFGKTRLVSDLTTDDFRGLRKSITKTRGHVSVGNTIQRIRSVFKFAYDAELIDKPVRFGPHFRRPQAKAIRQQRHENGQKMFEPEEIHKMLAEAGPQLRAMILLGINCGFGNDDVATLPIAALDLSGGWVDYPRPKTAVPRRCPLWPETVAALREALAKRPTPKVDEAEGQVFVTKYGKSWHKDTPDNPISNEMRKLLDSIGHHMKGVNFYSLRHTFETIAGESIDQVAVNAIMGHVDRSMAAHYRERIGDDRLRAVVDRVHAWLFPPAADSGQEGGDQEEADEPATVKFPAAG